MGIYFVLLRELTTKKMARIDTQNNLKRKRKINAAMLKNANKAIATADVKLKKRTDLEEFFKAKKKN